MDYKNTDFIGHTILLGSTRRSDLAFDKGDTMSNKTKQKVVSLHTYKKLKAEYIRLLTDLVNDKLQLPLGEYCKIKMQIRLEQLKKTKF